MALRAINHKLVSEDIEGLNVAALKKSYRRYKKTTSKFRNKNVRDPIDHLDFELNIDNELSELKNQLETGSYHPKRPLIHYSPKKHGISRPTVTLHIEDVIVYRFCLEQIDKELVAITRQKNIRGGVMASPTSQPEDGDYYEKWFADWTAHNNAVRRALTPQKFIATSDISSYFDNVDVDVLVDMLREAVKDKRNLLSLLSFFLHGVKLRYTYATKLNTGLVQDDSDSSRILAYFYLHPHDIRMIEFTKKHKAHFFRYVDDMCVVVKSNSEAMLGLKTLTDSLRKLGLIASIEKTSIATADQATQELFYRENDEIQVVHDEIYQRLRAGKQTKVVGARLKKLYEDFKSRGLERKGAWVKLLKRFYTLATYIRNDFLLDDLDLHLKNYPILMTNGKIQRYLIANSNSPKLDAAVSKLIQYCDSPENLYPQAETGVMEALCSLDFSKLSVATQLKIQDLAQRMVFTGTPRSKNALCEYSNGISVYLLYKCDPAMNLQIARQYIKSKETPEYLRKCMALVSLTCTQKKIRKEVLTKLRADTSIEMKRLAYMITNLKQLRKSSVMKRYKNTTKFYLWGDTWKNGSGKIQSRKIELSHMPIRVRIIRDVLSVFR